MRLLDLEAFARAAMRDTEHARYLRYPSTQRRLHGPTRGPAFGIWMTDGATLTLYTVVGHGDLAEANEIRSRCEERGFYPAVVKPIRTFGQWIRNRPGGGQ